MAWYSGVTNTVKKAWKAVKEEAEEFIEDVKDVIEDTAEDISDAWNNTAGGFFGVVAGIIGTIGALVDGAIDLFAATVDLAISMVGIIVGTVVGVVVSIFSPTAGPKVAEKIFGWTSKAGDYVGDAIDLIGDIIEAVFGFAAGVFIWIGNWLRCVRGYILTGISPPAATSFDEIDHFFFLILENRSFDHMLGWLNVPGVDGAAGHSNQDLDDNIIRTSNTADQAMDADPPHEFAEVQMQLKAGVNTDGFAKVWQHHLIQKNLPTDQQKIAEIMAGTSYQQAPVIHSLAAEFAVCNSWFSSMPGPTFPNRLFAMAGSSAGLANSPIALDLVHGYLNGVGFDNGNIFQALEKKCVSWRIYHGDMFPMANALRGIFSSYVGDHRKINPDEGDNDEFARDLATADSRFPAFNFIEPDYGRFWSDFKNGNSQHPLGAIEPGEKLIKHIYEQLRASAIWERSALIITYDEHGGFYDHVVPPATTPPGDGDRHKNMQAAEDLSQYSFANYKISVAEDKLDAFEFGFDRLGVRVPAVIVSPLIDRNTVIDTVFDHSSIIKSLCDRFNIAHLTERDKDANSIAVVLNRDTVRDTPTTLP